ncbi:hypothetical protein GCM10011348_42700 [Marinobacterium nitratireducens]|uniref:Uncharacterized protein n=1 Tax=Marinobacterium nitratireducens TaxID=518897 RepID=A0A917ZPC0_9GAMM|nr:hypothetical protein GCM10011348_42700 [Marinobacterium nitratireducens]
MANRLGTAVIRGEAPLLRRGWHTGLVPKEARLVANRAGTMVAECVGWVSGAWLLDIRCCRYVGAA